MHYWRLFKKLPSNTTKPPDVKLTPVVTPDDPDVVLDGPKYKFVLLGIFIHPFVDNGFKSILL